MAGLARPYKDVCYTAPRTEVPSQGENEACVWVNLAREHIVKDWQLFSRWPAQHFGRAGAGRPGWGAVETEQGSCLRKDSIVMDLEVDEVSLYVVEVALEQVGRHLDRKDPFYRAPDCKDLGKDLEKRSHLQVKADGRGVVMDGDSPFPGEWRGVWRYGGRNG